MSEWRQYADDVSDSRSESEATSGPFGGPDDVPDDVEGIPVEDMDVLTLECGIPVEDKSLPRRNYLYSVADDVEDYLHSVADAVNAVEVTTRGDRTHREKVDAVEVGPMATVDVHTLEDESKILLTHLLEAAETRFKMSI